MVTFDKEEPGTPAAVWDEALTARRLAPLNPDATSLVVIAAHPDDETLGAGGLIAAAARLDIPVHVIVVTDGGASHPDSPTHRPEQLVERREAEVRAAVERLAPGATVTMLGYPDGQTREFRAQIVADLRPLVSDPSGLVVAPWTGDGHRDHRVVGEIAAGLGGPVLGYPIWAWRWGTPEDLEWDDVRALRIDSAAKAAAVHEHTSQIAPLSEGTGDEAVLDAEFLKNFERDTEIFIVTNRISRAHFDDLYERHDDPWGFESRWYEARKRAIVLASLPLKKFRFALELGCSTGLLTEALADRCYNVLGIDIAESAVDRARERIPSNARVEQRDMATDFPAGDYDLVVLSEVGYYFSSEVLDALLGEIEGSLSPDGVLVACHWRHPVEGYLLSGDEVHSRLAARDLARLLRHEEEDFVLEAFSRNGDSVARRDGLL